jgi:uncharacterized glyoxalase superfamily protein PhnB
MALSLDIITLGVPQVEAARGFYSSLYSAELVGDGPTSGLDLGGTGRLALEPVDALAAVVGAEPASAGFRGYVLSTIVERPSEVRALLDAAAGRGATVVKPAKKEFFGEFTGVHRAPDGAVWKLAAAGKKDTPPVPEPPQPTETAVYLGVAAPKASRAFYEALGMGVRHDYGDKYIDFDAAVGAGRLGLLTRKALVLTHIATSREDVDALLAAAAESGGRITAPAATTGEGTYTGHFTDPDGYHWRLTARA